MMPSPPSSWGRRYTSSVRYSRAHATGGRRSRPGGASSSRSSDSDRPCREHSSSVSASRTSRRPRAMRLVSSLPSSCSGVAVCLPASVPEPASVPSGPPSLPSPSSSSPSPCAAGVLLLRLAPTDPDRPDPVRPGRSAAAPCATGSGISPSPAGLCICTDWSSSAAPSSMRSAVNALPELMRGVLRDAMELATLPRLPLGSPIAEPPEPEAVTAPPLRRPPSLASAPVATEAFDAHHSAWDPLPPADLASSSPPSDADCLGVPTVGALGTRSPTSALPDVRAHVAMSRSMRFSTSSMRARTCAGISRILSSTPVPSRPYWACSRSSSHSVRRYSGLKESCLASTRSSW
mmetsp:Transcript_2523/g.9996  ORF Transcript_2523/g.9996 Transcript_2523/m.9996 type:complete len:348 (+) Transcript_2523:116-1159(+)